MSRTYASPAPGERTQLLANRCGGAGRGGGRVVLYILPSPGAAAFEPVWAQWGLDSVGGLEAAYWILAMSSVT